MTRDPHDAMTATAARSSSWLSSALNFASTSTLIKPRRVSKAQLARG
jgi:hypothetical protein